MADGTLSESRHFMLMGIVLIVLGMIAIATPAVAGTSVVIVIGGLLLFAGIIQVVQGLRGGSGSRKLLPVILGVITAACGIGVLGHPLLGLKFLTLLLAIYFVVEGAWKILASFNYRPATGWMMVLISGIISLVLGVLIWRQWPVSGLWAVGVLVGINLIINGCSLIAVATTIRQLRDLADPASG